MTLCGMKDLLGWSFQVKGGCSFQSSSKKPKPPWVTAEVDHGWRLVVEPKAGFAACRSPEFPKQ